MEGNRFLCVNCYSYKATPEEIYNVNDPNIECDYSSIIDEFKEKDLG